MTATRQSLRGPRPDPPLELAAGKPDLVIHLAAVVGGIGANRENPGRFFYENAVMGVQLMEQSRLAGVAKFVQIGIRELVELITRLTGFTGEVRWDPSKPDGQPRRALDTSRARERFGFAAETRFEQGLRQTVAWYLGCHGVAVERALP